MSPTQPFGRHIQMPDPSLFYVGSPTENWYATLLHECSHWSGHKNRLNRFGPDAVDVYDDKRQCLHFEEMIAELSAALLSCDLGIDNEPRADHAQYVAGYIQALRNDPNVFSKACVEAEKAVNYLHSLQDQIDVLVEKPVLAQA